VPAWLVLKGSIDVVGGDGPSSRPRQHRSEAPSSAACIITAFAFDFPTGTAELLHERVASDPSNAGVRLVRRTSTMV
jgi:hypothetical protein